MRREAKTRAGSVSRCPERARFTTDDVVRLRWVQEHDFAVWVKERQEIHESLVGRAVPVDEAESATRVNSLAEQVFEKE